MIDEGDPVEAGVYAWFLRMPKPRAAAGSLVANASSAAVGVAARLLAG